MSLDVRYPAARALSTTPRWSEPTVVLHVATEPPVEVPAVDGRPPARAKALATGATETFMPMIKGAYDDFKACVDKGGLPNKAGCGVVEQRDDGYYVTYPPGSGKDSGTTQKLDEKGINQYKIFVPYARDCTDAGGMIFVGKDFKAGCFKVGMSPDQEFGVFRDQPIDIALPTDGVSSSESKDEGSGWGWWLLGGVAAAGAAVGGVLLWRRRHPPERVSNPLEMFSVHREASCPRWSDPVGQRVSAWFAARGVKEIGGGSQLGGSDEGGCGVEAWDLDFEIDPTRKDTIFGDFRKDFASEIADGLTIS